MFFLPCLKSANPEENFVLFKQLFLIKTVKVTNINKKNISPKSEPSTVKLCLSVVLKHFGGNSLRTFLLSHKMTISETSTEIL